MFGNTIILLSETHSRYGYDPQSLSPNSRKLVTLKCQCCGEVYDKEYRASSQRHRCPIIKDGQKRCYYCEQWKSLKKFPPCSTQSGGVGKLCRQCKNSHPASIRCAKRTRQTIRDSICSSDPTRYLKYRIRKTINKANRLDILCDLDYDHMLKLWDKQNGKCYYTNHIMNGYPENGRAVWNSPSIDRLTPNNGYVKGNVVWCVNSVNIFKGSLCEIEFLRIVHESQWKTN